MNTMRKLLVAALMLAAGPLFAAGLTDFELTLQNALAQTDKDTYAKAVAKCKGLAGDADANCWRPFLLEMAKKYTADDGKVDAQNPENSFTPLERKIFNEIRKTNPRFDKLYTDSLATAKDPKNKDQNKHGKFVEQFRKPLQEWMTSYVANAPGLNTKDETTKAMNAMEQARAAILKGEKQFDNNTQPVASDAVIVGAGDKKGKKDKVPFTDAKDDKNAKRSDLKTGPPPTGDLELKPEKPENKNKWNDTIAGGKGAIWAGMIALILGGPVGALVFGAIGFGVFSGISKMNNA